MVGQSAEVLQTKGKLRQYWQIGRLQKQDLANKTKYVVIM